MRRIEREDLAPEMADALRLLQEEVENLSEHEGFDPGEHWKRKRTSQPILAVYAVLKLMAGPRERCMYCVDSAGSDIEHFWPKGAHSDRMYIWENLLVACAPCGRFKGQQFPLAADGSPLLEHFSYCCRALNGSRNQALASSAVSMGSICAMA